MKYDLAILLKSKTRVSEIKTLLLLVFSENHILKGWQIINPLREFSTASESESILYTLKENGVLINIKSAPSIHDYQFQLNCDDIDNFFTGEELAAEVIERYIDRTCESENDRVSFVSTIPNEMHAITKKTHQIEPALIRLISKAKNSIWIINPFFDKFGANMILDALIGAAKHGVQIKMIGRDFEGNLPLKESLHFIASEFMQKGLIDYLEYRDFFSRGEDGKQKYALHTKMLISDQSAYVGSANLTEHSMRNNFELGVIIEGKSILPVISLVEEMWDYARRVNITDG
ncbi:phosphatidylserine/phosphatidylglycerophosphate/cardiolipin synthase family protein [Methanocorpusculum sp. GPch4]|uniref:phospholipase D-like domain-containing protein n=1 Tax=Methanocorpusculum sp. GPch4 TaxID=2527877 RepID=UPI001432F3B2|nr:phospholipase D-like domain-containing protein [Methanocorpusculum sp. GPch4]